MILAVVVPLLVLIPAAVRFVAMGMWPPFPFRPVLVAATLAFFTSAFAAYFVALGFSLRLGFTLAAFRWSLGFGGGRRRFGVRRTFGAFACGINPAATRHPAHTARCLSGFRSGLGSLSWC